MTRAEMMARMSQREWLDWRDWMALYPEGIGERGAYYRAGTITAWAASAWRDSRQHPDPFKPSDIFPSLAIEEEEQPEPTPEETAERMRMAFRAQGKVIDLRAGG